jgi:signal transduction histidine kinase
MSHEIRTPLGAILGFADLVVNPEIRSSEKVNFVSALKRNGELLSNIINEILDLSKIEAGKMQITPQEAQLRKEGYTGVIIALTAHAMNDVRELCLKSGFNDHISKPVNSDVLIERINSLTPPKQNT